MNPKVLRLKIRPDYCLEVQFSDGQTRLFDTRPYLTRGVFKALQDEAVFRTAHVVAGAVEWQGEIDLSHDTIYLNSTPLPQP
ncbi:MAG: DUF2442 domain-containing protein [Pseudomonadota bacterium]